MLGCFSQCVEPTNISVILEDGPNMADNQYANAHRFVSMCSTMTDDGTFTDACVKVRLSNDEYSGSDAGSEAYVYYLIAARGENGVSRDECMQF